TPLIAQFQYCCDSVLLIIDTRYYIFLFFFSSRRRHTRFSRDWSSDVCSSDLDLSSLPPLHLQTGCEHNGKFYRDGDRIPNAESRSEERRVGKECRSRGSPDQ